LPIKSGQELQPALPKERAKALSEIKAHQLDRALPDAIKKSFLFLVHGNDAGHVHERALQIANASGVSKSDPFLYIHGDADDFLSEPGRLVDEATSLSMFGGKKLIWLHLGARNALASCQALLEQPVLEAIVILEGGELRKGHALRTLCETAPRAVSINCFADESDAVHRLAVEILASEGKTADEQALLLLSDSLGSDRAITRKEIEKLLLYAGNDAIITTDHVDAIIIDATRSDPSLAIDAAFQGQIGQIEPEARRMLEDGMDAGVFAGFAYRHALMLISILELRQGGAGASEALKRNGVHFRREASILQQLSLWSPERLLQTASLLNQTVMECRKMASLGPAILIRALWTVALSAKRA
jgi:DNA polymerase III subunit delta